MTNTRDLGTVEGFDLRAEWGPDLFEAFLLSITVIASKAGIDLGSDSLHGIDDDEDFFYDGEEFVHGYGPDLIATAVAEAKAKLEELTK